MKKYPILLLYLASSCLTFAAKPPETAISDVAKLIKEARINPDKWHDLTIEIIGDHYYARIDNIVIEAQNSRFSDAKGTVALINRGQGARFENVQLWPAKPKAQPNRNRLQTRLHQAFLLLPLLYEYRRQFPPIISLRPHPIIEPIRCLFFLNHRFYKELRQIVTNRPAGSSRLI